MTRLNGSESEPDARSQLVALRFENDRLREELRRERIVRAAVVLALSSIVVLMQNCG